VLKAVAVMPFAKFLVRTNVVSVPAQDAVLEADDAAEGDFAPEEDLANAEEESRSEAEAEGESTEDYTIPATAYILADVAVLTLAGFFMGAVSGYYFIGISWKARDWPGMIAFIVSSLVGSALSA